MARQCKHILTTAGLFGVPGKAFRYLNNWHIRLNVILALTS